MDYVLHGGDFFDVPAPALVSVLIFLRSTSSLMFRYILYQAIMTSFGHNIETLPRTMLGFAARLGIVHLVGREAIYLEKKGLRVQLTGQGYHYEMDRRDRRLDYVVKKKDCDYAIHMVHGMLLQRALFPGAFYTLIEQISDTEADFTLAGHNHLGFPDTVIDGKYFINPGASGPSL